MTTRARSSSPTNVLASAAGTTSNSESVPPPAKRFKFTPVTLPSYGHGLHLAPMVRIGTLPTRLVALENGATLVWGPEIVDRAIIGTERIVDERSGTIKYVKNGRTIFECHPLEKSHLIFQLGSADPDLAVAAALIVANDVRGVGLNCGCPKSFSLSGGMGAALLKVPDKLCSILVKLVEKVPVPIDVKIRLLPDQTATLALVAQLAQTGISALTVHCRTQDMRSSEPALLGRLKEIVDSIKTSDIPVIANGDCFGAQDRERIEEITGVSAIMIARGAEANPSCFRPEGPLDPRTVVLPLYLKLAIITGNHYANTRYCVNAIDLGISPSPLPKVQRSEIKQKMNQAKTIEAVCELFQVNIEESKLLTLESLLPELVKRNLSERVASV